MKNILILISITLLLSACSRNGNYGPVNNQYQFEDDFDDNRNGWNFADGANLAYGVINNGTFKIDYNDDKYSAYYVSQQLSFLTNQKFTIESRIGSDNNMGLLFGYNDQTNAYGYSITIDYNGKFALYDEGGNGYGSDVQTLIAPTAHSAVNKNGNWNTVKLVQNGNTWYGYINGTQVFTYSAQTIKGSGVGFVVLPKTQGEADYIYISGYR